MAVIAHGYSRDWVVAVALVEMPAVHTERKALT